MSKKQQKPVPSIKPLAVQSKATLSTKAIFQNIEVQYHYLFALLVGLVGVLLYVNTFNHGYVLDDQAAINYRNDVREGLAGIPHIFKTDFWHYMNLNLGYYRPLSLVTFAIEHQFFGVIDKAASITTPDGQKLTQYTISSSVPHIGNAIFYGFTGFVSFLMLQRWFYNRNVWFTFLVALLFISFPTHTEVVANIKSRDEILSFLNMAATILLFTTYQDTGNKKYLWWSLLTAYLAYLSKESSIIMLGIFPLVAYYLRGKSFGQSLATILPYLGITLLFFIQKKALLGTLGGQPPMDLMVYPYAVEKTRFLSMFKQFAHYLRILAFPHPLIYDYSYNQIPSGRLSDPITWAGIVGFGTSVWLGWKGFLQRTLWGFALALFFATLVPSLAFTIMRGGIMAERFLYAPALAWCIILAWLVFEYLGKKTEDDEQFWLTKNTIPVAILLIVCGLYAIKTVTRAADWKEEYTLFLADEYATPNNTNARKHLGDATIKKFQAAKNPKEKQRLFEQGVRNLKQAVAIYPQYGEAYFGVGYAYQFAYPKPNYDSAAFYYRQCIRLTPRFVVAYNNLGNIYEYKGQPQIASYWYNKAVEVNPSYINALTNKNRMLQSGINTTYLPDSLAK